MDEVTPTAEAEEEVAGAPGTEEATADTGAPAAEQEPGHDWEQRYNELRSEHNRRLNLWNRAQQGDIEAMRELQLPVDFGDDNAPLGDEQDDSPLTELQQQQQALAAWAQQQEAQAAQERFNKDLDQLLSDKDFSLNQRDRRAVLAEVIERGDGFDALKSVVDEIAAERAQSEKAVIEKFLKSKRTHHVSPGGTGATDDVLPLDASHKDRVKHMLERYELGQQQS